MFEYIHWRVLFLSPDSIGGAEQAEGEEGGRGGRGRRRASWPRTLLASGAEEGDIGGTL